MKRRLAFKLLAIVLGVLLVLAVVVAAMGGIMAWFSTKVAREPISQTPAELGLPYEDVSFLSREDELDLRGWFISGDADRPTIILVHGGYVHRADQSIGMLDIAGDLYHRGYNILTFDLRAHGESEGNRMTMGYFETRDLLGAIDYLQTRGISPARVGILGFSMGAAAALLAAPVQPELGAVVSDSAYADAGEIVKREMSRRSHLPSFIAYPMFLMQKLLFGFSMKDVRPEETVGNYPRPILFIHGQDDSYVPSEHAQRLLNASNNSEARLWLVPEAEHARAYKTHREEYVDRVDSFFEPLLR